MHYQNIVRCDCALRKDRLKLPRATDALPI